MIVPVPYVHIGIGLTSVLLAIPLIRRKVPMNRLYGVRSPKAFASERNWYEINAYGGRLLLMFGLFVLGFGVLTLGLAPAPTSPWAPAFMAVPLLAMIPVIVGINRFARRLPDE